MTDVLMILDENGGDIVLITNERAGGPYSGEIKLTDGKETDILHALFGGRTDPEWWGNLLGDVSYKSETQKILENLPLTSGNLVLLETAITKDLENAGMSDIGEIAITIPQPNRVSITVGEIVIERNWPA